jgi:ATP-dependent DNA helicase RecG
MKKYAAESQNIEFKSEWRDEYLKTLCAFVNTKGGELIVGMDDKGNVIGVKNAKKLLEDIPNKIKNKLGITPSVIQKTEKGKDIISIEVPAASAPVSCDGKYFRRSGSTTSELNGNELANFLLLKYGKTWDSLASEADFNDLDINAINIFKNLAKERISSISDDDSIEKILYKRQNKSGKIQGLQYI